MLTIGVPNDAILVGPTEPSAVYAGVKTFKAPIYNVTREFYLGDQVEVKRDSRKGEFFVIVKFKPMGVVTLYQASISAIRFYFVVSKNVNRQCTMLSVRCMIPNTRCVLVPA